MKIFLIENTYFVTNVISRQNSIFGVLACIEIQEIQWKGWLLQVIRMKQKAHCWNWTPDKSFLCSFTFTFTGPTMHFRDEPLCTSVMIFFFKVRSFERSPTDSIYLWQWYVDYSHHHILHSLLKYGSHAMHGFEFYLFYEICLC